MKAPSPTKWARALPSPPGSRARRALFPKMLLYRNLATYVIVGGSLLLVLAAVFSEDFKAVRDGRRSLVDLKDEELEFLLSGLEPPPSPQASSEADPGTEYMGDGSNNQVGVYEIDANAKPKSGNWDELSKVETGQHGSPKQDGAPSRLSAADKDNLLADDDIEQRPKKELFTELEQEPPRDAKSMASENADSRDRRRATEEDHDEVIEASSPQRRRRQSTRVYENVEEIQVTSDQPGTSSASQGDDLDYNDDVGLTRFSKKLRAVGKKKKKKTKVKKPKRAECPITYNGSLVPPLPPDLPSLPSLTLSYVAQDISLEGSDHRFAGHQTLQEREESFALDRGLVEGQVKRVHCGFVAPAGRSLGKELFSISERDKQFLQKCRIAVVSALFGNFDQVHRPQRTRMTVTARRATCFVLFLDAPSMEGAHNDSLEITDADYIGLWRLVVVGNLPYKDNRMNGKIPKLLAHRLLPNAQYSIWVDSKLRLYTDPLVILQRFLTEPRADFSISRHYDRTCVWEEVARNKFLKKFSAEALDKQLETYSREGLRPFNPNDTNRLLPSYVPEGSFFMRAHNPVSNLFTCLWFNEVDRFSSRDQISFALVYHRLVWSNPGKVTLRINMFRDCDKRAMVKLFHHRDEEKQLLLKKQQQVLDAT